MIVISKRLAVIVASVFILLIIVAAAVPTMIQMSYTHHIEEQKKIQDQEAIKTILEETGPGSGASKGSTL